MTAFVMRDVRSTICGVWCASCDIRCVTRAGHYAMCNVRCALCVMQCIACDTRYAVHDNYFNHAAANCAAATFYEFLLFTFVFLLWPPVFDWACICYFVYRRLISPVFFVLHFYFIFFYFFSNMTTLTLRLWSCHLGMFDMQCAPWNARCTMRCAMCDMRCVLCNAWCALCNVWRTMYDC